MEKVENNRWVNAPRSIPYPAEEETEEKEIRSTHQAEVEDDEEQGGEQDANSKAGNLHQPLLNETSKTEFFEDAWKNAER